MQVSDGFWLTFREETYAYSKHPRILWIKNLLAEICLFNTQEYRVFTQVASIYINLLEQKTRLHKKRVQLPQDWFGTPTWPPFHCFGTPIWLPWRHVKTQEPVEAKQDQAVTYTWVTAKL